MLALSQVVINDVRASGGRRLQSSGGGSVIVDFSILRGCILRDRGTGDCIEESDSAFSSVQLSSAITRGVVIAGATLTSGVEIISADDDRVVLSTTSTVMTHADHGITFIPGGPAGTVAMNETHHITSSGDVIEALNSSHHIDAAGAVTSHVEANLTREFHGLTDEHLDNHTAAGSTHDLVHLYNPALADSGWLDTDCRAVPPLVWPGEPGFDRFVPWFAPGPGTFTRDYDGLTFETFGGETNNGGDYLSDGGVWCLWDPSMGEPVAEPAAEPAADSTGSSIPPGLIGAMGERAAICDGKPTR